MVFISEYVELNRSETTTFRMNQAFEVSDTMKYESCTHPQPNEIKCNVQYKLSPNRIKNFEDNNYFYDWGSIEEIHIPGKNLTTYLKWMRVKN